MWKSIFLLSTLILSINGQTNNKTITIISNNDNTPDFNSTALACGDKLTDQTATDDEPITYYRIDLDGDLNYPVITVCHEQDDTINTTDTAEIPLFVSLLKSVGNDEDIISHENDITDSCDGYGLQLNLTDLVTSHQYGMYYISVTENTDGLFTVEMICESPSSDDDKSWVIFAIVLGAVCLYIILFCTFYWVQIKRLKKYGTQVPDSEQEEYIESVGGSSGSPEDKTYNEHLSVELGIDNDIQYNNGSFIDLRDAESNTTEEEEKHDDKDAV
eukprot:CAMPEP_0201595240 /NCGR_PEP_ID=MMETSP0190_2-20130828/192304_1 /ASSEMBLY_ACC=CAM_ASM_000263 /TAXON_ID=37353 /ORGANISM="Rosalina sp." /LENGTH=272 /DNA_ID=CAMNT_0048055153 /DNA_START=49 /DNA_END=867 /DNA_ORIENTATION=-